MVQQRRSEFFSLQGGGRLFGSNIAENGCCAKAQGISHSIDVVELMLRTVCLKGSFSAMFQQEGEGFIQWRKLARHLPSSRKNRSLCQGHLDAFTLAHIRVSSH
jgi:hypothetical protein